MQKHVKFTGLILLIFLLFTAHFTLTASETYRSKSDTLRYLKLTHIKTGDTIMLKTGEFIKVVHEKRMYEGTIDSIKEHSFYMDGKEFELQELSFIMVNHRYMELKKLARVFLWITIGYAILTAILTLIFGVLLFTYSDSELLFYLSYILGFMIYGMSIVAAPAVAVHFRRKLYERNLKKRWRIESVAK